MGHTFSLHYHLSSNALCHLPLHSYESVRFPDDEDDEGVSGRFSIGHSNPHRLPTSELMSTGYRPNLHALLMDTTPLPPPPASPVPSQGSFENRLDPQGSLGAEIGPQGSARDANNAGLVGRDADAGPGPSVAPPPSIRLPPVPREAIKHAVSSPLPNLLRRVTISGGGPVPTVAELIALRGSEIPSAATAAPSTQFSRGSVPNLAVFNAVTASSDNASSDPPTLKPGASAAAAIEKGFYQRTSHRSSGGGGAPSGVFARGDSGLVSGSTLADDRDDDLRGALALNITSAPRPGNSGPINVTSAPRPGNSGPIPTAGRLVAPEHEMNRAVSERYPGGIADP